MQYIFRADTAHLRRQAAVKVLQPTAVYWINGLSGVPWGAGGRELLPKHHLHFSYITEPHGGQRLHWPFIPNLKLKRKKALSQTIGGCFRERHTTWDILRHDFQLVLLQINPMWTGDESTPLRITVTYLLSVTRAAWNCNVMIDNLLHGTCSPLRWCYCWQ